MKSAMELLHDVNPYEGFVPTAEDLHGWGGHPEFFESIISSSKPKLIVEVGTWKGRSAITMADICKKHKIKAQIVCVDTWLGAAEFWVDHSDEKRYKSLGLKNGYPTVYYQFLSNVVQREHEDVIVPFPQASSVAAKFFKQMRLKPDLVYIDASHEYDDVLMDLRLWHDLLAPGGRLFGDDYCDHWHGVKHAVNNFYSRGEIVHTQLQNEAGRPPSDYWIGPNKEGWYE